MAVYLDHAVSPGLPPPEPEHPVKAPGHHEAVCHRVEAGCVHVAGVTQSGHLTPALCDWSVVSRELSDWSTLTCSPDQGGAVTHRSQHEAIWMEAENIQIMFSFDLRLDERAHLRLAKQDKLESNLIS